MNSLYLSMVLRLIGFLATSDLFAVERAALARRMSPALLTVIEHLVAKVDASTGTGADKKQAVITQIPGSFAESSSQINQAIEWAVAKMRAAKGSAA